MTPVEPPPTLSSTRSGAGWKLPALVVVLAVLALVGLSQLGGTERPTTSAPATAVAVDPSAKVQTTPGPEEASLTFTRLGGVMPRSADGLTYADGIPTGISGQAVYRVRDVLMVPVGRTMLVGGWWIDREYVASPVMSDVDLVGTRPTDVLTTFVALDSMLAGTGAYVVLATLESDPDCSIYAAGECQPRLRVLSRIWSGLG